jgi:hypothetical protein
MKKVNSWVEEQLYNILDSIDECYGENTDHISYDWFQDNNDFCEMSEIGIQFINSNTKYRVHFWREMSLKKDKFYVAHVDEQKSDWQNDVFDDFDEAMRFIAKQLQR